MASAEPPVAVLLQWFCHKVRMASATKTTAESEFIVLSSREEVAERSTVEQGSSILTNLAGRLSAKSEATLGKEGVKRSLINRGIGVIHSNCD